MKGQTPRHGRDRSRCDRLCPRASGLHQQGLFDDPRFELVIADGKDFAATCKDTFDVIIVDSTDPVGPGEVLFTRSFYSDCKRMLADGGVLVTQNGVTWFQPDELHNTVYNFAGLFADAGCYLTVVPTYSGGFMALGWGTDNAALRDVSLQTLQQRFEAADLKCRYYTPDVHKAAFALPGFIGDIVRQGQFAGAHARIVRVSPTVAKMPHFPKISCPADIRS
jgi:spermidine synthase